MEPTGGGCCRGDAVTDLLSPQGAPLGVEGPGASPSRVGGVCVRQPEGEATARELLPPGAPEQAVRSGSLGGTCSLRGWGPIPGGGWGCPRRAGWELVGGTQTQELKHGAFSDQ